MKDNCILTAESVTEGHPDKLCDTIADAVVDACLTQDAAARVACEVMATAGKIIAAGEITAAKIPDIPAIICRTVREAGYGGSDYEVEVITHEQSPDIAEAVCGGAETGAGDQGILYGFACDETKVTVKDAAGAEIPVMVYIMAEPYCRQPALPSPYYYRVIQRGFEANGLPVESLQAAWSRTIDEVWSGRIDKPKRAPERNRGPER